MSNFELLKLRRIRETLLTGMLNISPQLAEYIKEHAADDPDRIRLAGKEVHGYSAGFVANQIEARQRHQRRFPNLCSDPLTIFPPNANLEQSSSEATAREKVDFLLKITGSVQLIIDLSTGFGVDALALSTATQKLMLVEPDAELRAITQSNTKRLLSVETIWAEQSAEEFLNLFSSKADWIYVDPSRRKGGAKVYRLEETSPNPVMLMSRMLQCAHHVLVKASPMLDLSVALQHWSSVKNILILSVSNECREVLFHLSGEEQSIPLIHCLNLMPAGRESFLFYREEEEQATVDYSDPLSYLFEPNASIMKAGAFKLVAQRFGLHKLANHTHLYTSDVPVIGFPGRTFEVIRPLEKNDLGIQANILSRNHPLSPDEIRKKFKVTDGGDQFIIACSGVNKKFLLLTHRLNHATPVSHQTM